MSIKDLLPLFGVVLYIVSSFLQQAQSLKLILTHVNLITGGLGFGREAV